MCWKTVVDWVWDNAVLFVVGIRGVTGWLKHLPSYVDKHKRMTDASSDPVGLDVLISLRCVGYCVV